MGAAALLKNFRRVGRPSETKGSACVERFAMTGEVYHALLEAAPIELTKAGAGIFGRGRIEKREMLWYGMQQRR